MKNKFAIQFKIPDRAHFDLLKDKVKAQGGIFESANKRWIVALDPNDDLFLEPGVKAESLPDNYQPLASANV
jgi:hypothetical protein